MVSDASEPKVDGFENAKHFIYKNNYLNRVSSEGKRVYIDVIPLLAIAKGLLNLNDRSQEGLIKALTKALKRLSQGAFNAELLNQFVQDVMEGNAASLTVMLPDVKPYDKKVVERRQRMAMLTLIAA
ncbi:hypothetical protein ACFL0T_03655 [Candidatus Omnitrophota bacterium]